MLKEKNSALEDMVNAMFLSPGLSHDMWGKSIISFSYLLDKIHCKENKIVLMKYGSEEDYLISYKWIFKKKMKADGTIDKYKARLVIKGFRQRECLDYFDAYLPVTRITSIRMVLAIAELRKLEVYQMDVKMIFLNKDLEKVLYMNQPEGFMTPGLESKV
ncbi:retrovirus-related pol polyprotein from transposon TNT 1-94 [Tanacetum coccineum]|uniref:Retrovirus-related pol polyprotein from transposon TNT 1-94 n=1 Tax=Tanacetum coccineum TaxID=301880 RepID=A0ABQ5FFW6_9ASTR